MRVDVLLTDRRCYTYEAYAAEKVSQVFSQLGLAYQIFYLSDGILRDYLMHIEENPPAWTLSFANLTPHQKPLCDVLGIPHFFWLQDSFSSAVHFLDSRFGKIGSGDQTLCNRLQKKNVYFLPLGIEKKTSEKKEFDAVMFADVIDTHFLEESWKALFTIEEIGAIERAIKQQDPLSALPCFYYVEQYLKAQKTHQALSGFQQVRINVFGDHAGNNWLLRLPRNVHLHATLPYTEHFEVLRASKVVILEPSNPWYLPAIAAGCLPLPPDEMKVLHYLNNELEREKCLKSLQNQLADMSWEKQTKRLMECMQ